MRIILSKTNRMGDVIGSMPTATALKKIMPDCHIIMLVTRYTLAIAKACSAVDECVAWDDPAVKRDPVAFFKTMHADVIIHLRPDKYIAFAAKRAKIPLRIGGTSRIYNWLLCNKLLRVNRRKYSPLHDMQCDIAFIAPLVKKEMPSCAEISDTFSFEPEKTDCEALKKLTADRFNLIIHPKNITSRDREWPLAYYAEVIAQLDPAQFNIFITGTERDGQSVRPLLCDPFPQVTDLTGKLSIPELMSFVAQADGLLAGSTGPLHMAAALGIYALGLYTHTAGHQPSRWKPLGKKADYLVSPNAQCVACQKGAACRCILDIKPASVVERLQRWKK